MENPQGEWERPAAWLPSSGLCSRRCFRRGYTLLMITVTLQTNEVLLASVSDAIARRHMTLDQVFDEALRRIAEDEERVHAFDEAMRSLGHIHSGGPYTRDEMNEG